VLGTVHFHILLQLLEINLITDGLVPGIHFLSQNQKQDCINWIEDIYTLHGMIAAKKKQYTGTLKLWYATFSNFSFHCPIHTGESLSRS
jgi:hypothetical protein